MHDAAAQDDAPRRVDEHEVRAHLRQVVGLDLPDLGIGGQLDGRLAPALLDGRAGGHALKATGVARAAAGAVVSRHARDEHVASLGVEHAVQQPPAEDHARAHAGADGHVDEVAHTLRVAEGRLAQTRDVDVGVVAHGHAERVDEGLPQVAAAPRDLRRFQDVAEGVRRRVHAGGAERADAQRLDAPLGEPAGEHRQGLIGRERGERLPLEYRPCLVANGAHHLRAARLKRSDSHDCSFLTLLRKSP